MAKLPLAIGISLALSDAALPQQNSTKEQTVDGLLFPSSVRDGRSARPFLTLQSRAEISKIEANDRAKATSEKAQAIVASTIALLRYVLDRQGKQGIVGQT